MSKALFPRSLVRLVVTIGVALFASVAALVAQTPSAADGFDPNVNGNVYASALQPDGRILIAGQFTGLSPNGAAAESEHWNIARLNPDGTLDQTFTAGANGPIRALVQQADGRILIGGEFTEAKGTGGGFVTRNNLARLNADGTLDTAFNPSITGATQPVRLAAAVYAIALQPNGDIVVGGAFGFVQPPGTPAPVARRNLARLTAAGALDVGYDPNPNGMVMALASHVDGKMLVGGGFTSFQENGKPEATTRSRLARLNIDGSVDPVFDPKPNNGVLSIVVQRDGLVLFGGYFTKIQPPGFDSELDRSRLARVSIDGRLDDEFTSSATGTVSSIALQPDGGFVIGGAFTSVSSRGSGTLTRNSIARFTAQGAVDPTFAPGLNGEAATVIFQPDGKVVIGGYFTRAQPPGTTSGILRNRVARFNPNGTLDAGFELDASGRPLVSITQADGKIVIGGSFTAVGGTVHNYLARLNADGTVDNTYNPFLDGRVVSMAYESGTNRVIIGGDFTQVNGETRNRIARLNADGTLDGTFDPNFNGRVHVIFRQADGKLVVGGQFSTLRPPGASEDIIRYNLVRFNTDGTLESGYYPGPNSSVDGIVQQSDGKLIIVGGFSFFAPGGDTTNTINRNYVARLNADGTVDGSYDPNPANQVMQVALQSDGKVVIAGAFNTLFPLAPTAVSAAVTRNFIARLNADGTLDASYDPSANNMVLSLVLQPDGKAVIGGYFTALQPNGATDSTPRRYLARLNPDGTVDADFDLGLNQQVGTRVDGLRVLPDGKVYVAGSFNSLQPAGSATRVTRKHFVRLNADGSLDNFEITAGGAAGGTINALVVQPDGKVVVGGAFSELGGTLTANLARFNPEGSPDTGFNAVLNVDGTVNALAIRPNGAPTPTQVPGLALLTAQGALRGGFTPGTDTNIRGTIRAAVVQPDGGVIVVGSFSNLTNYSNANIARFRADGTLDTTFLPSVAGEINDIALQGDGKVIIVGGFTSVNGTTRNYVARLNADGTLDTGYDPSPTSATNAVVIQPDGRAIIAGAFTALKPNGATDVVGRTFVARINLDGTLDTFSPAPTSIVHALAIQGDRVIIGGEFTGVAPNSALAGTTRNYIARINNDGSLDTNFDPNPNGIVRAIAVQANDSVVFGGEFSELESKPNGNATPRVTRNRLARVAFDGTVDANFDPNPNAPVTSLAIQPDGGVLVGGSFTSFLPAGATASIARKNLARITADGTLDGSFNPSVDGSVTKVLARTDGTLIVLGSLTGVNSNGSLLVGGSFNRVGGVGNRNLALLNDDGSLNPFAPLPNGAVHAMLPLADGRFLVGGEFTTISGATRNRVARYSAAGVLDAGFDPNADGTVRALAVQADGKVLVGGTFTTLGGLARPGLGRLNADGTLDAGFAPGAITGAVAALAVQPDGRILVAYGAATDARYATALVRLNADGTLDATFAQLSATALPSPSTVPHGISSIALQADGKVLIVGGVSSGFNAIARLNADGTLDTAYRPQPNSIVRALALQSDGRALIAGSFTTVGGLQRVGLARLANTGVAVQTLGVSADRDTVYWARSGTAVELAGAVFERSTDGRNWTALGTATRLNNSATWRITGVSGQLPADGFFYLRARGIAPASAGASASVVETVRQFDFSNRVPAVPVAGTTTVIAGSESIAINAFTGVAQVSTALVAAKVGEVDPSGGYIANPYYYPASGPAFARLANISTRGIVRADTPLIAGFNITGDESRTVLVRAIGPTLGLFGVNGVLPAAKLRVYNAAKEEVASNDGWADASTLAAAFAQTGAFPLPAGSADAAALVTLPPGSYTVHVVDGTPTGTGGVALAEVYDAGSLVDGRLANLSNRGTAIAGERAFIGGFVLVGNQAKRLLVRGVGPGLTQFSVVGALADPKIALYNTQGNLLASNDNWSQSDLAAATASLSGGLGAFALEPGSKDAALIVTLAPGAYTVQISGPSETATGATLMELYELP